MPTLRTILENAKIKFERRRDTARTFAEWLFMQHLIDEIERTLAQYFLPRQPRRFIRQP